jgi:hypothetical protein
MVIVILLISTYLCAVNLYKKVIKSEIIRFFYYSIRIGLFNPEHAS